MEKEAKKELEAKLDVDYKQQMSKATTDLDKGIVEQLFCHKYKQLKNGEDPYKES